LLSELFSNDSSAIDPTQSLTFFAPTDNAFLSLPDALGVPASQVESLLMPQILATVLEYHFVPGNYSEEELVMAGELDTVLGEVSGTPAPLSFNISDTTDMAVVSGQLNQMPSNILEIAEVCAISVYKIDQVLVPYAALIEALPALNATSATANATAPTAEAPAAEAPTPANATAAANVTAAASNATSPANATAPTTEGTAPATEALPSAAAQPTTPTTTSTTPTTTDGGAAALPANATAPANATTSGTPM
jgi:hypothetical protein